MATSPKVFRTSIEEKEKFNAPSTVDKIPVAESEDDKLRKLGIRRELRREFSNFSTLSFALGVIGSVFCFSEECFLTYEEQMCC